MHPKNNTNYLNVENYYRVKNSQVQNKAGFKVNGF